MTNVISSAFDTVTTVEQGVELLDIFMHLSTREVIKIYAIVHLVTSKGGHFHAFVYKRGNQDLCYCTSCY